MPKKPKAENLESMIKRGGGITKHQALATAGMDTGKKKGKKGRKKKVM